MKSLIARRAVLLAAPLLLTPAPSQAAPPAGWPPSLVIGTGSPGGVYVPYGQALADILTETLGIRVTAQATQASAQNILLMESGVAQLGMTNVTFALEGWNGTGAWTRDRKLRSMRALVPMYVNPVEIVALKSSGIRTVADMAGKRVAPGPPNSAGGIYTKKLLALHGIQASLRFGAYETFLPQLKDGSVDAFVSTNADPSPVLAELDRTGDVRFIPLNADEVTKLSAEVPGLSPLVVPAGMYPSMTTDYTTVGTFNFIVVSKDLPDDLVYEITKAFYANHERMVKVHESAKQSTVESAKRVTAIPYHPGAARYYREIGIAVPDTRAD
jgi:uncharacterized protein